MTPESSGGSNGQVEKGRWHGAWEQFFPITFDYDVAAGEVCVTGADRLGYDSGRPCWSVAESLDAVHPDDRNVVTSLALQVQDRPSGSEIRIRNTAGEWRWMRLRSLHQFDPVTQSSHLLGILEESCEHSLQDELAAERARHAQTSEELREFTYVASHDLQEPLRTITSMIELLNDDHRSQIDPEGQEYLDFIHGAAGSLQLLINDLLTFSRISSQPPSFSTVELDRIVAEALRYLQAAVSKSGAEVHVDTLPALSGDPQRLLLLFQNLIANAVKFRSKDRRPVVRVTAREDAAFWIISVKDNGIGIEPSQHDKIFRIFYRLHPASQYAGTGLGLAICERIVRRHGGRIWVESPPSQGACFHVALPR